MPRHARILGEKQVYHIMLRGNNRENIFIDDEDKTKILDILGEKKREGTYNLYAYCVMDNHIHLVVKEGKDPIARIIKRIGTSYAHYFNKKYKRIGHVFQDRFKSEIIGDDSYLLAVIRYIHQNPLKPGLGTIRGYNWSSYKEYINKRSALVDSEEILDIFSKNKERAVTEFSRFNHEKTAEEFLDIGEEKEINQENVQEFIAGFLKIKNIEIMDLSDPTHKPLREELIKELLKRSSLSKRGIAVELGLSREMVRRTSVSEEPSL